MNLTLKNPMIAISFSLMKAWAASTVPRVLVGGLVFFSKQETMVLAVQPPLYSEAFEFLKKV